MPTPACDSMFTDVWLFIWESHTAWFSPYAVLGTVPSPSSAFTVTLTGVVVAPAGTPPPVKAAAPATSAAAAAMGNQARRRLETERYIWPPQGMTGRVQGSCHRQEAPAQASRITRGPRP